MDSFNEDSKRFNFLLKELKEGVRPEYDFMWENNILHEMTDQVYLMKVGLTNFHPEKKRTKTYREMKKKMWDIYKLSVQQLEWAETYWRD